MDAYELAYLAGGPNSWQTGGYHRVVETARAVLFVRGVLGVRPGETSLSIQGELPGDAHAAERAVYEAARFSGQGDSSRTRQETTTRYLTVVSLFDRLKAGGYLVADSRALAAKWMIAVAWGIAAGSIGLAFQLRHHHHYHEHDARTTIYFLLSCAYLTLALSCCSNFRFHLTQHGQRTVAAALDLHAGLRPSSVGPAPHLGGTELVLSVGLFGLQGRRGPLADLYLALNPPCNDGGVNYG